MEGSLTSLSRIFRTGKFHTVDTENFTQHAMKLLISKPLVDQLDRDTQERVTELERRFGRVPRLAVVLVGEDPASQTYTKRKGDRARALGLESETIRRSSKATPREIRDVIEQLNKDDKVDGILLQRPLPPSFREEDFCYWITPDKDVDGFHPENMGRLALGFPGLRPCTPIGIMALLEHYEIPVRGRLACVVGRSPIVGKPVAMLLTQASATVIQAHSKTPDLKALTKEADLVVVAAGKKHLLSAADFKKGAVVVDVGIHHDSDNRITGDVSPQGLESVCKAFTPVPGGVGPTTIAMLLQNTVLAAERRLERSH